MRYIYQNVVQDGRGNFVASATVTVTLAGGSTKASIYSALTGGTVDADGIITTGTDGTFAFYVDEDDYSHSQQFRIVWSKSGYTSEIWDYIQIFPDGDRTLLTGSTVDQGDAAIVGTLAWHIADADGDNVSITVLPGTYLISQNITVPATMSLIIPQPVAFTDDAGDADLTINGEFIAGQYQIFDWGNGSGAVTFGSRMDGARPEWWYSSGSYHTAIEAADAAYPVVIFSKADYAITTGVTMTAYHRWIGAGGGASSQNLTRITLTGAITGITFDDYCQIENIQVEGTDTADQIGIASTTGGVSKWRLNFVRVENCDIGIALSYTWTGTLLMCELRSNATGLKFCDTVPDEVNNNIRIIGGEIQKNSSMGIHVDIGSGAINNLLILGTLMESNDDYGIRVENGTVQNLVVQNCWFEDCGIGMQFETSINSVSIEHNRFYLQDDGDSHAIVFASGSHRGTLIARNDIDRSGTGASVAIEFNEDQNRPRVEYNQIDSNLSITDSSALPMLYINKDGQQYLSGLYSLAAAGKDTGQNFAGTATLSNPNTTVAVSFGVNEPDTSYGVYIGAPQWEAGHIWITNKAVGGFTINVETTISSGSESLFWMIVRS